MSQSSSVVFSLQELSQMEQERVRSAAETQARERALEERTEREAQARREAEQRARQKAEDEARREAEQRLREEAARIAAIHHAAREAARATAEARVQAEERELARRHALELEQARALASRSSARPVLAWAALGALVTTCLATAVQLRVLSPRAEAELRGARGETAARDRTIAALGADRAATEQRLAEALRDVSAARDEAVRLRAMLEARPPPLPPPRTASPSPGNGGPRRGDPRLDGLTSCAPGSKDPLCLH